MPSLKNKKKIAGTAHKNKNTNSCKIKNLDLFFCKNFIKKNNPNTEKV